MKHTAAPRPGRRDAGFTLPELLITVVLTALVGSVIAMTIITSMRTAPSVTERADSAVAVQGLTTWLPPDVDSAVPGQLATDPSKGSGCTGLDPGINLLHLSWDETFNGTTRNYVADYRFTTDAGGGQIVRVGCSGSPSLGAPSTLKMSAKLSTTLPTVSLFDTDGDGLDDQVKFTIETLSGDVVYIDAASKNPDETLPPDNTSYPTTTAVNQAPVAVDLSLAGNPSSPITFMLPASDPDGDALSASLAALPSGWGASVVGLNVTLTPDATMGTFLIPYIVHDPSGANDDATIEIVISTVATTTSTTSSTTTTIPPCVVSNIIIEDSPVQLSSNGSGKLKKDVKVTAIVQSGYCVGLTLQYDTGAPNGQYVQNLGDAAPYQVTLLGHPHGTELWSTGTKVLRVYDGTDTLLAAGLLEVTD